MVHLKTTKASSVTNIKMRHKKNYFFHKKWLFKKVAFSKKMTSFNKNLPGSQNCFIVRETETQF